MSVSLNHDLRPQIVSIIGWAMNLKGGFGTLLLASLAAQRVSSRLMLPELSAGMASCVEAFVFVERCHL